MIRNLMWLAAGAIGIVVVAGLGGLIYMQKGAHGFSARAEPSFLEAAAAQQARSMAMPAAARHLRNPIPESREALQQGMAHWADHCAICHANDGSGQVGMGRQMYPHSPDMRKAATQQLTDGELFYIIENGIRLTGMPAWGGSDAGVNDSWRLVQFIRHLPDLTQAEVAQMEKLNPKGPEDKQTEQEEDDFLNGQKPNRSSK